MRPSAGWGLALVLVAAGLLISRVGESAPPVPALAPAVAPPTSIPVPQSDLLSFKQGLARIWPVAQAWNSTALLERCYSLPLSKAFLASVWSCTFITPDGKQRRNIAASTKEVRQPDTTAPLGLPVVAELQKHAPLVDQMLDSSAVLDKLTAQQIKLDASPRHLFYYIAGQEIGVVGNPHPLVQVWSAKDQSGVILDAITGQIVSK